MEMTNQEAIKRIEEHIAIHKYRESHAMHIVEALDLAISALQAQDVPDTNVGDMVSRQAAIDALLEEVRLVDGYYVENDEVIDKDDAIEAIRLLPSVTPKRKTGKWIEYDSDEDKYDVIKCPCCKHTFTVDAYHWTDIGFVKDDFKYCPNCGADMRQREENK